MVHALIEGPAQTPYAGGIFHFVLDVPDNYPHSPPRVRLMTTGNGTVRFNPQFYTSGKALMNEMPALNEPGMMLMSDPEEYNTFLRHETLRVAVLGIAGEAVVVIRAEEAAEEVAALLGEEGAAALPSTSSSSRSSSSGTAPRMGAKPQLPAVLAHYVLDYVCKRADELEVLCLAACEATPDGTVLRGVPRPTRTMYAAMACDFISFQGEAANCADGEQDKQPGADEQLGPQPVSGEQLGSEEKGDVEAPAEPKECRICGGGESDGELIQPCGCSGSIAFVHRSCAAEWIRRNGSPVCTLCRKAYSDPALRALGAWTRCQKSCASAVRIARLLLVLFACHLFSEATGGGLERVEVASQKLGSWRLHPGPSEASEYLLRGKHLRPAHTPLDRWYKPLVEGVVLRADTPWRERPVAVELPLKTFSDLAVERKKPSSMASLLGAWRRRVVMRQARKRASTWKWVATIRGAARCAFQKVLEPLPTLFLRLRPACSARVAAIAVLFAWLALDKRCLIWVFMSCHVGFRFAPAPLVAAAVMGSHLAVHQVHRRLARLGMFRRRPEWEADLFLISILFLGTFCAGFGTGLVTNDPEMSEDVVDGTSWVALRWAMLIAVCMSAMATVARPPEGRRGACARRAAVLHGLLWALCGALLCLLAAAPVLFPAMSFQTTIEVEGDL